MKRSWAIRRRLIEVPDAAQRWDRAFQHLLRWAQAADLDQGRLALPHVDDRQEVRDEDRGVCAGIDTASSSDAIH